MQIWAGKVLNFSLQSSKLFACKTQHTVLRILKSIIKDLEPSLNSNSLPEHLSFDEFKSVKEAEGAMSFIYSDARTHDLINIIEDRQQKNPIAYFQRYPYSARKKVKTVTIDV